MFNDIPLGICVIKSDNRVMFWNSTLEDRTDILYDEIVGNKVSDFFADLKDYSYSSLIEEVFKGGPPVILSSQLHKSLFSSTNNKGHQHIQNIMIKGVPAEKYGEFYALITIDDVTSLTHKIRDFKAMRDQALEEIERRKEVEAELQKLNATKDKFFSIIAHDLKNPIGAFKNVSEVLSTMLDDLSKEEVREFIDDITVSSSQLFKLLENLLMWSRSQTGSMNVNKEEFELKYIIDSNLSLMKMNADSKEIELKSRLVGDLNAFGDQNMINTVIRNLISNALKFTDKGGVITISTKNEGDNLIVSISDTGMGMTPETMNKLFRIDQHHTTRGTNNETGTGLGLILCQDFVHKQGGDIWVESEIGKGSTFSFSVPKFEI
jgi:signal transduction histidine kinase